MPSLITDPNVLVNEWPNGIVYVSDSLQPPNWQLRPFLRLDKLSYVANGYDEAHLSWEVGEIFYETSGAFDSYTPLSLVGKFVRITVVQPDPLDDIEWIGYVVGTAIRRAAVKGANPNDKLSGGRQELRAVGLEYFLDRVQIDSSVIYGGVDPVRIFRSIPFNGGKGVTLDFDTSQRGNRSPTLGGNGVYGFVATGDVGVLWTYEDIIKYLFRYFTPTDSAGDSQPFPFNLWIIHPQDENDNVLDMPAPTIDADGMTVFQVLNKLLAPQRGFVWSFETIQNQNGPYQGVLHVETLTKVPITLPALGTLPANRDQQSLDFDRQADVNNVTVAEAGKRRYDQIIVRGARMTGTGTLGFGDLSLDDDWSATIETEYDEPAENLPDMGTYAAYSSTEKSKKNDAERRKERFNRIFTAFRIPANWDGKVGDGGGGATENWVLPVLSANGSIVSGLPLHIEGLRILNTTRLKRGWDYEDVGSIEETTPSGTEAEYMAPFAILAVTSSTVRYQFADKMTSVEHQEGTPVSDDIKTSYHLTVQQNTPGIILRPTNGVNHALGLNHFTSELTEHQPEVDYETLRVTCTMEADSYAEAQFPELANLQSDIPLQKLLLYVGDEYRLDFLAANTVVDLTNGEPVLTNGGVLRDDRKHLQDIARLAWEWYRVERLPITVEFRQLANLFRLGMYISTIGEGTTQQNVNTVITQVMLNFENGTTTFKTNDQDLDLERLV